MSTAAIPKIPARWGARITTPTGSHEIPALSGPTLAAGLETLGREVARIGRRYHRRLSRQERATLRAAEACISLLQEIEHDVEAGCVPGVVPIDLSAEIATP